MSLSDDQRFNPAVFLVYKGDQIVFATMAMAMAAEFVNTKNAKRTDGPIYRAKSIRLNEELEE